MALGDVTSNERGSGARYNDGKPDMSLIPLALVAQNYIRDPLATDNETTLAYALLHLGTFQVTGNVASLDNAIRLMGFAWFDCAKVLAIGAKKYAPWNWAKGMPWAATIACAGRHALKVLELEEQHDDETGETHYGHFLCNLVFLRTFVDTFPEGNDLPDPSLFQLPEARAYAELVEESKRGLGRYVEIPVEGGQRYRMSRADYDAGMRPVLVDGQYVLRAPPIDDHFA
jgi:hypothetical protein